MNNQNAKRIFIAMMIIAIGVSIYGYNRPVKMNNRSEVYYYISVRDFADSDQDGEGDLQGIINSLDYLNDANPNTDSDLGITAIVLSPVNSSLSNEQNEVVDFYDIDSSLGSMDDMTELVDQAHQRGIKVIMSFDFNHTSIEYPWFKEAVASKESQLRDYYIFDDDRSADLSVKGFSGEEVWQRYVNYYYYSVSGKRYADLNYDNQEVRNDIKEVASFYLEKDVDGFRLEYPNYIYTESQGIDLKTTVDYNIDWWREFKAASKEVNSDVILISDMPERSASSAPYYKEMDSNMNYFVAQRALPSLLNEYKNIGEDPNDFAKQMEDIYSLYKGYNSDFADSPFLSSEKLGRIMDTLSGDRQKAKVAAAIQFTLMGNPVIYYGDELGIGGFLTADERKLSESELISQQIRIQGSSDSSMLSFYKKLIDIKKEKRALYLGDFIPVDSQDSDILTYVRYHRASRENLLVIHNISQQIKSLDTQEMAKSDTAEMIYSSNASNEVDDSGNIMLQPLSSVIIEMD